MTGPPRTDAPLPSAGAPVPDPAHDPGQDPAADRARAASTESAAMDGLRRRPTWQRVLWLLAGALSLGTGIVGIFLPLLPTTPFVLLAAFCFSRGSTRCERWLLGHPRFGPMVRNWRQHRAIPLRAKQLAWTMMALGSAWAGWVLPLRWAWLPALCCAGVALWMWRLPSTPARRDQLP